MANIREIMTANEKDLYGDMIMDVDTNLKYEHVILSEENQTKVDELRQEMKYAREFEVYGLKPMNKLLFYGASGTGKTLLAKALSNELDYYMLYVDIGRALSNGDVSRAIADIFTLANKYGNCIVFFDECDSVAVSRDNNNSDAGPIRRATNTIFQYLDQMNPTNIFVAATNMLHRLDAAFENRFNLKLEFRRPELKIEETAARFIRDAGSRFELVGSMDEINKATVDKRCTLSYRELKSIVERQMKKAIIRGDLKIPIKDLYEAVAIQQKIKIRFGTDVDNE